MSEQTLLIFFESNVKKWDFIFYFPCMPSSHIRLNGPLCTSFLNWIRFGLVGFFLEFFFRILIEILTHQFFSRPPRTLEIEIYDLICRKWSGALSKRQVALNWMNVNDVNLSVFPFRSISVIVSLLHLVAHRVILFE